MMKNIVLTAAAAALCAFAPATAMAQSTISGTVTVQKGSGPLLTCTATAGLDGSSPSTSTQVTSLSLTGGIFGLCATVQFPSVPHSITQGGGAFQVNGVFADTTITPGDCSGNLTGTISGGVVTFNDILEEVDPGTGDCTIDGSLS